MDAARDIEVAGALRRLRLGAGMTQGQLAAGLGKPQSYVAKLELGERHLRLSEAFAYADALGVGVEDLVAEVRAG